MVSLFNYPKRKLRKLVKDGDYKEAIEFGKSIENQFSNDYDYFFIMGSIYYILEDAQNAINYFDRSLEINDSDIESLTLKANVHFHLKENEQVEKCCSKILEIDPKNKDAQELFDKVAGS